MGRKTRRHGAGKEDTRHSPLARKLMRHRFFEKAVVPGLRTGMEKTQKVQEDLARAAATATPEGRANYRRISEDLAREAYETVKESLRSAREAKEKLQKKYQQDEDKEYVTQQALALKKGGRKTRRRRRHG